MFLYSKPKKPQRYYIVKDDFITNLKRGRPPHSQSVKTEGAKLHTQADMSSIMIKRKKDVFGKMKFYSKNDFYDLDRQIENNQEGLYRKLNVALRNSRLDCEVRMENPFLAKRTTLKGDSNRLSQEKQLSRLIFNVQPYWIKRSLTKSETRNV